MAPIDQCVAVALNRCPLVPASGKPVSTEYSIASGNIVKRQLLAGSRSPAPTFELLKLTLLLWHLGFTRYPGLFFNVRLRPILAWFHGRLTNRSGSPCGLLDVLELRGRSEPIALPDLNPFPIPNHAA